MLGRLEDFLFLAAKKGLLEAKSNLAQAGAHCFSFFFFFLQVGGGVYMESYNEITCLFKLTVTPMKLRGWLCTKEKALYRNVRKIEDF